jgi:hypothetical protein
MFPRAVYGKTHPVDLIANRTLISAATNRVKSNKKPSLFMEECLAGHGNDEAKLLATLSTHSISPEAHLALQLDDFGEFVRYRREQLLQAIREVLPSLPPVAQESGNGRVPLPSRLPGEPSVWLVRAGSDGAQEPVALQEGMAVIGWDELGDMRDIETRDELENLFIDCYGDANVNSVRNQVGQLWAFVRRIQPGDLVVLPRKASRTIAIGRVTGDYKYRPELPPHAHQARPVEWLVRDLPRDEALRPLRRHRGNCGSTSARPDSRTTRAHLGTTPPKRSTTSSTVIGGLFRPVACLCNATIIPVPLRSQRSRGYSSGV